MDDLNRTRTMLDNTVSKRGVIAACRRMSCPQVVVFGDGALVGFPWYHWSVVG